MDNFPNPGHPDLDFSESYPQASLNNNFLLFFCFIGASRLIEYLLVINVINYKLCMNDELDALIISDSFLD